MVPVVVPAATATETEASVTAAAGQHDHPTGGRAANDRIGVGGADVASAVPVWAGADGWDSLSPLHARVAE